MNDDGQQPKKRSCSDFFNEVFHRIENQDEMFARNEEMFLKYSEKMNWGFNDSDIPERPNPLFLEDNQIYLLVPYLNANDTKNGCQRSFDNFYMILSPNSFAKSRRSGRQIAVGDQRNNLKTSADKYRSGLRWVRFGIYKEEDIEDDVDYKNLIKRKAGLELLVFLSYYRDHFDFLVNFFGQFLIDGYNYFSGSRILYGYSAYVYRNEEGQAEIGMISNDDTESNCLFLVEDI